MDDKPYEERRGGSYVVEAGRPRLVATTLTEDEAKAVLALAKAEPEQPVVFAKVETVYGTEPADTATAPLAVEPAVEPEKPAKTRKGR